MDDTVYKIDEGTIWRDTQGRVWQQRFGKCPRCGRDGKIVMSLENREDDPVVNKHFCWECLGEHSAEFTKEASPELEIQARLKSIGIPAQYEECTMGNYQKPSMEHAGFFLAVGAWMTPITSHEFRPGVLLAGPTGIGKTHLAVGALKGLSRKHKARYVGMRRLIEELRTFQYEGPDLTYWIDVPALLIDDAGCGKMTDTIASRFMTIISDRIDDFKITILTTNTKFPGGCSDWLDDRLVSRMHQHYRVIQTELPDWRMR